MRETRDKLIAEARKRAAHVIMPSNPREWLDPRWMTDAQLFQALSICADALTPSPTQLSESHMTSETRDELIAEARRRVSALLHPIIEDEPDTIDPYDAETAHFITRLADALSLSAPAGGHASGWDIADELSEYRGLYGVLKSIMPTLAADHPVQAVFKTYRDPDAFEAALFALISAPPSGDAT